tara:strand:+ start:221 stop:1372 length:1152 start_codon:yes stop_codon:yes gene_type:complete
MSPTHDMIIDNSTGANVRADINNALAALVSNSSSSSEPATKYAYMWWADTTTGILKIRNSANNAWVELLQLDGTLTLEDGSASTPALAFRDDLNTGIFSSAADTFNVATAGVERMELGATTIFNEDGADVDFRIEGDSNANLFYVDAGNDRIGFGTNSPNQFFTVVGDTSIQGRIQIVASTPDLLFSVPSGGTDSRIHNDGSSNLIFGNGVNSNTPTEAMRLDVNRRLLLGTTSVATACIFHLDGNIGMKNSSTGTGALVKKFVVSRDYTMSTSAVQVLRLDNFGTSGFEITAFRRDTAAPHGMELQKLYIGVQGSGSNMTDATLASETKFIKGSIHNVTYSVADNNNFVTVSVTGDDNGGEAQSLTFYIIATGGNDGECTIV